MHKRQVLFPAIADTFAPAIMDSAPEDPVAGGTETILLVEDEEVLREMARDILTECGYKILEASSGKEAFDVWNRHMDKIQLVLTDMVMPCLLYTSFLAAAGDGRTPPSIL